MPNESGQGETPDVNVDANETPQGSGETPQVPETWDAFLEAQPEPVKQLFSQHVQGLKAALSTERDQRRDFEKQLRDVAKQLEDGSEAKAQLEQLSSQYEEAERRLAFYESAPAELVNAKLGWLAVTELDAFDRRGNVNWDAVREAYPELFKSAKSPAPSANAGAGTQGTQTPFSMNDAVRAAARRNSL